MLRRARQDSRAPSAGVPAGPARKLAAPEASFGAAFTSSRTWRQRDINECQDPDLIGSLCWRKSLHQAGHISGARPLRCAATKLALPSESATLQIRYAESDIRFDCTRGSRLSSRAACEPDCAAHSRALKPYPCSRPVPANHAAYRATHAHQCKPTACSHTTT